MSEFPWPSHLPQGWKAIRLKIAVKLRTTRVNSRSSDKNYIGLEAIESWTGRLLKSDLLPSTPEDESESNNVASAFEPGNVLFGKLRPYLAKGHLAREAGVCTTELLVMEPGKNLEGKFLLDVLLTREFINHVNAGTFGTKMPRADWDTIGNLLIPLPPLSEQRAIADFLDHETSRLDNLIAEKERLLSLLAEKRRTLITQAVTRGLNPNVPMRNSGVEWLGEIPGHWETPPVYARYEVTLGKMLDEKRISGTYLAPYLRNVDVQWHKINTRNLPEMDFDDTDRQTYVLKKGDLLICEGGEVGRAAIWEEELNECYYQKALHRLRPLTSLDNPKFFAFLIEAVVRLGIFAAEGNQSTIQHLTAEKLRVFRFPSPPYAEQSRIVANILSKTAKINSLHIATGQTIMFLHERRTALISAAVAGQICVTTESCNSNVSHSPNSVSSSRQLSLFDQV